MLTPYNEDLFIGSRFADRYQIIELVGKGSMGVVYKARHELMGRFVAIKMLRGQLQVDERSIRRFEREARAASRLDHPNVITVHDFGLTEHRQPYLVMDFASGVTLFQIQKREAHLLPERAVHIFTQACDALHHAHIQGVIHRDLKPSNIMIMRKDDDPDFVKVFDLGIAKIAWGEESEKEDLTNTGEVCGSPVYLSPEQCKQETIDHRTDIYSLGVVMYEMLTGVPPLMGETVYDTIYLHVNEDAPRFSEVCDLQLPPRLEEVVLKALRKDPGDRQQTMQELKLELVAALAPPVGVAPPDLVAQYKQRKQSGSSIGGPSTAETLKDEIRALRASVEMIKAIPGATGPGKGAQAAEPAQKRLGPVAMTAILSSVVSIVATLAVLAIMGLGKQKAVPAADVMAKQGAANVGTVGGAGGKASLSGGTGEITDENTLEPVRGEVPGKAGRKKRKTSEASATTDSSNSSSHKTEVKPPVVQAATKTPKPDLASSGKKEGLQAIAPKVDTGAPEQQPQQQADNGSGLNSFFSIFQPGKSAGGKAPPPPKVAKGGKKAKLQSQAPVMAPQDGTTGGGDEQQSGWQQPQQAPMQQQQQMPPQAPQMVAQQVPQQQYRQPIQQAIPQAPSLEEQQQAVALNNEAVGILTSDPQAAIEKLNRALRLNPSYTKAKIHLGNAYHNLANQGRANGQDMSTVVNEYRQSLNLLKEAVGSTHPAYQATKQDYENFLQTAGAK